MNDSIQTIFKSARHFFSGTILSRIAGMLRDMSMAYAFGTQASIAAFMLAFRLAHLLRRLLGEGALQSAFIPEFEALRQEDPQRALRFFRNLKFFLIILLSTLIFCGCLALGALLTWGHFSPGNQQVAFLMLLMLPSLLFICLFGLNASLLQCEKKYFTPSVAPVAFNIIWILIVLALQDMPSQSAMPYLAIGVIVACFCQWLMTVPATLAILKHSLTDSLYKDVRPLAPDVLRLSGPLLLGIIGVGATQINNAIDALFARFADPEGPALLWYAIRLQQLPLALFGIAIAGAILPPLSRAIKSHDWVKYHHFLQYALRHTAILMLPITGLLLVAGDSCVNLIYGRGDFTDQSIAHTTLCLWAYGIGLLPSCLVLILAPASYAQSNYRLPAYASFLTILLNCTLNAWMIMGLGLGAVSVALATSISAWVNMFFLTRMLRHKNGNLLNKEMLYSLIQITATTGIAILGVALLRSHEGRLILLLRNQVPSFPHDFGTQLWNCLWQLGSFSLIFTALNWKLLVLPKKEKIRIDQTHLVKETVELQ